MCTDLFKASVPSAVTTAIAAAAEAEANAAAAAATAASASAKGGRGRGAPAGTAASSVVMPAPLPVAGLMSIPPLGSAGANRAEVRVWWSSVYYIFVLLFSLSIRGCGAFTPAG